VLEHALVVLLEEDATARMAQVDNALKDDAVRRNDNSEKRSKSNE
jgi:hypothetical protein